MPASTKKRPDKEKLLAIQFESLKERTDSLLAIADKNLDTYKPEVAAAMFEKVSSLIEELTGSFSSWLLVSTDLEDDKILSVKSSFNNTSKIADEVLVKLKAASPVPVPTPPVKMEKPSLSSSKLRKVDFRPLEKSGTKNWFHDLEIVFKAMGITEEDIQYAALLRLIDAQTSNLLTSISRSKPDDSYSQAKALIISEFSLSKYDRAKLYLLESSPGPEENLSHFASRIEVLFDDLSLDDIRKFTVLRHAPSSVRLQLAGSGFDSKSFVDLVREADQLTQRAKQDSFVVGAIQNKSRTNPGKQNNRSKVCSFHVRFGNNARTCSGEGKCLLWSKGLPLPRENTSGNDAGKPSRG
ncbi:Hypothetical predicted protein [Paramuricea clavata]|uniref:Uncharacterized protein n=1 Tax=Paramuricea clavata TaxID=317549 RepID=A0A7D9KI78_PARCT|nr:Hypothetical predicted protein [Paramuricea clavata]